MAREYGAGGGWSPERAPLNQIFSVINFEKFQHYRHRAPVWIKLYHDVLDDYRFARLPDAAKAHLMGIWLLATRNDNKIPLDPEWVGKRIGATAKVDLHALRDAGFIVFGEETLADGKQPASPEKSREEERKEEDSSADADTTPPLVKSGKKAYPDEFEEFWRAYPTDPLMSKSKALEKWRRLSAEDRAAALQALPGFRAHCARDATYRPVHAERFLSQRRFDGFNAEEARRHAAMPPPEEAALRRQWGGNAEALVEAIGAAKFQAWFAGAEFEAGPPVTITVEKPFAAEWIQRHFMSELRRLYGTVEVEIAK